MTQTFQVVSCLGWFVKLFSAWNALLYLILSSSLESPSLGSVGSLPRQIPWPHFLYSIYNISPLADVAVTHQPEWPSWKMTEPCCFSTPAPPRDYNRIGVLMTMKTEIARMRCFLAVSVFVSLLPLLCFALRISLSQRNLRGMKEKRKRNCSSRPGLWIGERGPRNLLSPLRWPG